MKYYSVIGSRQGTRMMVGMSKSEELVERYMQYLSKSGEVTDFSISFSNVPDSTKPFYVDELEIVEVGSKLMTIHDLINAYNYNEQQILNLTKAKEYLKGAYSLSKLIHRDLKDSINASVNKTNLHLKLAEEKKRFYAPLVKIIESKNYVVENGQIKQKTMNVF